MSRAQETNFQQSLMERLSERAERASTQASSLRMLKEEIRRDLEGVLNTRRHMGAALDGYPLAAASVVNYGLEDLHTLRTDPDGYLLQMQRVVQQCVAEYEPRLTQVTVSLAQGEMDGREIRLHIEARLQVAPAAGSVFFDTVFDVANETYSIGS
jgi:type VI secretion system protein ImpF